MKIKREEREILRMEEEGMEEREKRKYASGGAGASHHHHELSTTQLETVQPPQLLLPFKNLSRIMVVFQKSDGSKCRGVGSKSEGA